MTSVQPFLEAIRTATSPLLLATLVRVEGSSYRQPGARLLMDESGPIFGSLSGGCLEADVFAKAQGCFLDGQPRLLRYDLRTDLDLIWGTGSGCAGAAEILVERVVEGGWLRKVECALAARKTLRLATGLDDGRLGERFVLDAGEPWEFGSFVETFQPPIALWIFGASEDAKPLTRMAKLLDMVVHVVDHRPAFARVERFPEADSVQCLRPASGLGGVPLDTRSAAVVMTHQYDLDSGWMRLLMPSAAGYVGLMGHRKRGQRILDELVDTPTEAQLRRFYSPVGLDLGSEAPEGIALAILAELQACHGGRQAQHLREGRGAIHGPALADELR